MADFNWSPSNELFFKVLLRDLNPDMVAAWQDPEAFGDGKYTDLVEVRRRKLVTDGQLVLINSVHSSTVYVHSDLRWGHL